VQPDDRCAGRAVHSQSDENIRKEITFEQAMTTIWDFSLSSVRISECRDHGQDRQTVPVSTIQEDGFLKGETKKWEKVSIIRLQMTSRRVFRSKTVVIEACRLAKTER
jgi:hypothetical protein